MDEDMSLFGEELTGPTLEELQQRQQPTPAPEAGPETSTLSDIGSGIGVGLEATGNKLQALSATVLEALGSDVELSNYRRNKMRGKIQKTSKDAEKLGTAGQVANVATQIGTTVIPAVASIPFSGGATAPVVAGLTSGFIGAGEEAERQIAAGESDFGNIAGKGLGDAAIGAAFTGVGQKLYPLARGSFAGRTGVEASVGAGEAAGTQMTANLAAGRDVYEDVDTAALFGAAIGGGMSGVIDSASTLNKAFKAKLYPSTEKVMDEVADLELDSGRTFNQDFKDEVYSYNNIMAKLDEDYRAAVHDGDDAAAQQAVDAMVGTSEKYSTAMSVTNAAQYLKKHKVPITAMAGDAEIVLPTGQRVRFGELAGISEAETRKLTEAAQKAERAIALGSEEGTYAKHLDDVLLNSHKMFEDIDGVMKKNAKMADILYSKAGLEENPSPARKRDLKELKTHLDTVHKELGYAYRDTEAVSWDSLSAATGRAKFLARKLGVEDQLQGLGGRFDPISDVRTAETAYKLVKKEHPQYKYGTEKTPADSKKGMSQSDILMTAGTFGSAGGLAPIQVAKELRKKMGRRAVVKGEEKGAAMISDLGKVAEQTGNISDVAQAAAVGAEVNGIDTGGLAQDVARTADPVMATRPAPRVSEVAPGAPVEAPTGPDTLMARDVRPAPKDEPVVSPVEPEPVLAPEPEPVTPLDPSVATVESKVRKAKEAPKVEEVKVEEEPKAKPLPIKPKSAEIIEPTKDLQNPNGLVDREYHRALDRKTAGDDVKSQLYSPLEKKGVSEAEVDKIVDKAIENVDSKLTGNHSKDVRAVKKEAQALADEYNLARSSEIEKEVEAIVKKPEEVAADEKAVSMLEKDNFSPELLDRALDKANLHLDEVRTVADVKAVRKAAKDIKESGKIAEEMTARLEELGATDVQIKKAMSETGIRDLNTLSQTDYTKLATKVNSYRKAEAAQSIKDAESLRKDNARDAAEEKINLRKAEAEKKGIDDKTLNDNIAKDQAKGLHDILRNYKMPSRPNKSNKKFNVARDASRAVEAEVRKLGLTPNGAAMSGQPLKPLSAAQYGSAHNRVVNIINKGLEKIEVDAKKALDKHENLMTQIADLNDTGKKNANALAKLKEKHSELKATHEQALADAKASEEAAVKLAKMEASEAKALKDAVVEDANARQAERDIAEVKGQYKLLKKNMNDALGGEGFDRDLMNKALWKHFNYRNKPHEDLNEVYQNVVNDYYSSLDRKAKANATPKTELNDIKVYIQSLPAAEQAKAMSSVIENTQGASYVDYKNRAKSISAAADGIQATMDRAVYKTIAQMVDIASSMKERYPHNKELWVPYSLKKQIQDYMGGSSLYSSYSGNALKQAHAAVFGDADAQHMNLTEGEIKSRIKEGVTSTPEPKVKAFSDEQIAKQTRDAIAAMKAEAAKPEPELRVKDARKDDEGLKAAKELAARKAAAKNAPKGKRSTKPATVKASPKGPTRAEKAAKAKAEKAAKAKADKALVEDVSKRLVVAATDLKAARDDEASLEPFMKMLQAHFDAKKEGFNIENPKQELRDETKEIADAVKAQDPSMLTGLNFKTADALDLDLVEYFNPKFRDNALLKAYGERKGNPDDIESAVLEDVGPEDTGFEADIPLTEDASLNTGEPVSATPDLPQGALSRATGDGSDIDKEVKKGKKAAKVKKPTDNQIDRINDKLFDGEKLSKLEQKMLDAYPEMF